MSRVLITGGTGLIGSRLSKKLSEKGYSVAILGRAKRTDLAFPVYTWDIGANKVEREAIETADHIVHLAGENVLTHRWSREGKKRILQSRVKTAELLFAKARAQNKKLLSFVSASAIGYYGAVAGDKIFEETDMPGHDFLADVCVHWERAADRFEELNTRVVKIRTSPVLSKHGGALQLMKLPVSLGLGSALGTGKQYLPWIHIDDLCAIYIKAIEDTNMHGVYNAAAPDQVSNEVFMRTLARVMKRPFWFPNIPAWALKLFLGERGEAFLSGNRISCEKIRKAGFDFSFPELENALRDLI